MTTPVASDEVLKAMEKYGGSFIQAWAYAFRRADATNARRLREAFPEYWERYTEIAQLERDRGAAPREGEDQP